MEKLEQENAELQKTVQQLMDENTQLKRKVAQNRGSESSPKSRELLDYQLTAKRLEEELQQLKDKMKDSINEIILKYEKRAEANARIIQDLQSQLAEYKQRLNPNDNAKDTSQFATVIQLKSELLKRDEEILKLRGNYSIQTVYILINVCPSLIRAFSSKITKTRENSRKDEIL